MGFLKALGRGIERAVENHLSDDSFRRGQNAEPPRHIAGSDRNEDARRLQQMCDERYRMGQSSVLVKIGNKIAD